LSGHAEVATLAPGLAWNFTEEDEKQLSNASVSKTLAQYVVGMDFTFHSAGHWLVGSVSAQDPASNWGDFFDVTTSPNDVSVFWGHHTNTDRIAMTWMREAQLLNASNSRADVMWGFPVDPNDPDAGPGNALHDVVNANFGFTSKLFKKAPESKLGYTHFEVL